MIKEPDVDRIVLIGLFGSPLLFLLFFIMAVYYLIKFIKTKEITYECDHCKSKLKDDEMIRNAANEEEVLLKTIKKRNYLVK